MARGDRAKEITLSTRQITNTGDATRAFGEDPGLIIARPGRPVTNPFFFTVPEGFHALVSSWGRIVDYEGENGPTDCWPPGFHWGHPMTKVLYLVTQQAIVFDAPCRGVLTRDNVSISIDVAVVFRVLEKDVKQFAVKVNPKDLEIRLQAQVDQAVKNLGREITTRDAYGLRSVRTTVVEKSGGSGGGGTPGNNPMVSDDEKYGAAAAEEKNDGMTDAEHEAAQVAQMKGASATQNMRIALNRAFKSDGIEITDVIIKDVDLPDAIQKQLEEKTNVDSRNKAQRMTQKKEVQSTTFNEVITKLQQSNEEAISQAEGERDRDVNAVTVDLQKAKAELNNRIEEIRRKAEIEVESVKQQTGLQAAESEQKVKATLTSHEAQAKAEAQRIETETEAYVKTTMAKAELESAKFKAKASILMSEAEGEIASQISAMKEYETEKRRLDVYAALSENPELTIAPQDEDGSLATMMVADEILQKNAGKPPSRSTILAEMVIQSKGNKSLRLDVGNGD
mmetsp:Transcript_106597/g.308904  ORF Transcript_106597/g.308904 Transcript_106597/m.308904 type:complete len:509 (+) Transcript_106597:302-1828(+)